MVAGPPVKTTHPDTDGGAAGELTALRARVAELEGVAAQASAEAEALRRELAELAESEARLASVLREISDAIWSLRPSDDHVLYANSAVAHLYGRPLGHFTKGAVFLAGLHPDDRRLVDAVRAEGVGTADVRILRPDGEVRCVRFRSHAVRGADGGLARVDVRMTDITDERRAQDALQRSEERHRRMHDSAWDFVTLVDEQGQAFYVSGSVTRVMGYSIAEYARFAPVELFHPDDWELAIQAGLTARQGPGDSARFEARLRHKDGRYRWIETSVVNLLDEPAVRGVLCNSRDVTARKVAEDALRRLNVDLERHVAERTAALSDLYENAPCGFASVGLDGRFVRMNDTLLRWLGYRRDEVVGRLSLVDVLTPEAGAAFDKHRGAIRAGTDVEDLELVCRRKDGTTFPASTSGGAVFDAEGGIVEIRSSVVDITRRKHAEESLRESRDALSRTNAALQAASRTKDEFLASMSHELRTPLNAVLGLSEAILEGVYGPVSEAQQRALRRIDEGGRHLLSLISDILDLSKIDADRLRLEKAPVDVGDLCRASLRLVQDAAQRKRIGVSLRLDGGFAALHGDERRLKQVLVNLLGNAVKFTPVGGKVGIEVALEEPGDGLRFTVWDTGIGIAAAEQARLFQPFVQLDSSLSRQHVGTGLGPSLVRKLVELHGGSVGLTSAPERGSRFWVVLPSGPGESGAAPVAQPSERPLAAAGPGGARILLAEDDETNVVTVSDFLVAAGHDVTIARNGHEAVELARLIEPELILMDVQMPGLDGLAAIERIRAEPSPALRRVPILAVTAMAMDGDRERCLSAGATDYLTKPVGLRRLEAIITRLLAAQPDR
jgi:PAS domain S-box-containing protein